MKTFLVALIGSVGLLATVPGRAQNAATAPGANTAEALTPICTDRPTKSNVACTVAAGDVQIESDVVNWTRFASGGTTTDTILYTNPTVKYGLGPSTDIEANIAPYETVRTHGERIDQRIEEQRQCRDPVARRGTGLEPRAQLVAAAQRAVPAGDEEIADEQDVERRDPADRVGIEVALAIMDDERQPAVALGVEARLIVARVHRGGEPRGELRQPFEPARAAPVRQVEMDPAEAVVLDQPGRDPFAAAGREAPDDAGLANRLAQRVTAPAGRVAGAQNSRDRIA